MRLNNIILNSISLNAIDLNATTEEYKKKSKYLAYITLNGGRYKTSNNEIYRLK